MDTPFGNYVRPEVVEETDTPFGNYEHPHKEKYTADDWKAEKRYESPYKQEATAPQGFWETWESRDITNYHENQSYLKDVAQLTAKMLGAPDKVENPADKYEREPLPQNVLDAMDQLDALTEAGQIDTPQFAMLEEQVSQAIKANEEASVEAEFSLDLLVDAVKSDPGAAFGEMALALAEDPEFMLLGYKGAELFGAKTANVLARIGSRAATTGRVVGTMAGGAATDASLMVALEAARDLNRYGEVIPEHLGEAAVIGGVTGAVAGGAVVAGQAIKNTRAARKAAKETNAQDIKVRETVEEVVDLETKRADNAKTQYDVAKVINERVGVKGPMSKADRVKRQRAIVEAINDADTLKPGETISDLHWYRLRAGDAAYRIQVQNERRLESLAKIQQEKEAAWEAREAEQAARAAADRKGMEMEAARIYEEEKAIQQAIGEYIPEWKPRTAIAKGLEDAVQSYDVAAQVKAILDIDRNVKAIRAMDARKAIQGPTETEQVWKRMIARDRAEQAAKAKADKRESLKTKAADVWEGKAYKPAPGSVQKAILTKKEFADSPMGKSGNGKTLRGAALDAKYRAYHKQRIAEGKDPAQVATEKELEDILTSPRTSMRDFFATQARKKGTRTTSVPKDLRFQGQKGEINPKLLGGMGAAAAGAALIYPMMEGEVVDKIIATSFIVGMPFGLVALRMGAKSFKARGGQTTRSGASITKRMTESISDRIKDKSEALWNAMRKSEDRLMERAHNFHKAVNPFFRAFDALDTPTQNKLWLAMLNSDGKTINAVLSTNKVLRETYDDFRTAMDVLYGAQVDLGVALPYLKDYAPRMAKDPERILAAMDKEQKEYVSQIIASIEKRKKRSLTAEEQLDVKMRYLMGTFTSTDLKMLPAHLRRRSNFQVTPELLDAYADPSEAINRYIQKALELAYRRELFGKKISADVGDNVSDGITEVVKKFLKDADPEDMAELEQLLRIRMEAPTLITNPTIANFKNLTYLSLLGNPISAITQTADVLLSVYKSGLRNTLESVFRELTGRNKLNVHELGYIDNIAHETAGHVLSSSRKAMELSFKAGFKQIDALGKGTIINASFIRQQRLAKTAKGRQKLIDEYKAAWGEDEALKLIDDFENGRVTERTKLASFHALADLQPISLLEMPEWYLTHPNGRLIYTLQTFTMKFWNIVRQDIVKEFQKGNKGKALKNAALLATYATAGNFSTIQIKDFVLGRDRELDDAVIEAVFRTLGIVNRYSFNKSTTSTSPVADFLAEFVPPTSILEPTARALMNLGTDGYVREGTVAAAVRAVPVVGNIYYNFLMGGMEKFNEKHGSGEVYSDGYSYDFGYGMSDSYDW